MAAFNDQHSGHGSQIRWKDYELDVLETFNELSNVEPLVPRHEWRKEWLAEFPSYAEVPGTGKVYLEVELWLDSKGYFTADWIKEVREAGEEI